MVKKERVRHSEPRKMYPIEETVGNIALANKDLFFSGGNADHYSLSRVWQNNMIRLAGGELVDLANGTSIIKVEFARMNRDRGGWFKDLDFFYTGDTLIPLGTHAFGDRLVFKVYQIGANNNVVSETPLGDFLIDGLGQRAVLTRTLSEKEATKYTEGPEGLGSSYFPFWTEAIHTVVHNFTNEFCGEGYEKAVKFILSPSELIKLLKRKVIEVGTYGYIFPNRNPDSPFPFDFEIKINKDGFPILFEGYNRWANESGSLYIDNPFYKG